MKAIGLTMKKISTMTGYSVSTVSKALNDKKDISIETRNEIKGVAEKFNYIPNNYAVGLRGKRTKSIAVILPSVTISHYNQALFYLQKKAVDSGYRVLLYQTFNSEKEGRHYINSLNDGSVDGIFVISDIVGKTKNKNQMRRPVVTIHLKANNAEEDIKSRIHTAMSDFMKAKVEN